MAAIRLELSAAGIRPVGFFSRDRADVALLELQGLLRTLAPDGRPTALRWRIEGTAWHADRRPLFDDDRTTTVVYDSDAGSLTGEAGGFAFVAHSDGDGYRIRWDDTPLKRFGDAWCDSAGHLWYRGGPLALEVAGPARAVAGRITVPLLALTGGIPLPADAEIHAVWQGSDRAIALLKGTRTGTRAVFPAPAREDWPAEPWTLLLKSDLVLDGHADAEVALVEHTTFQTATLSARFPGEAIGPIRFQPIGARPTRVPISITAAPGRFSAEATAILDGDHWRIEPSIAIPADLQVPSRLTVRLGSQDEPISAGIIGPEHVHARWQLVCDSHGNARLPRLSPEFMRLRDVANDHWKPIGNGLVRIEIGDLAAEAPLHDDGFLPLLLADIDRPLWDAPRLSEPIAGPITAWMPGYPPLSLSVDGERRLRSRGAALKELLQEGARRGLVVRLDSDDRRGVVFPADGSPGPLPEVLSAGGRFGLHGGDLSYRMMFRGLTFDVSIEAVSPESDQCCLRVTQPLPIDGRWGPDVSPFLPMQAWRGPEGTLTLVNGTESLLLRPQAGRLHGEGLQFKSRWGFNPEWPREFLGEYAWNGLVFRVDADGVWFGGWLLDPAFDGRPSGPFQAYGFRAGPEVAGSVLVRAEGPRPPLPEPVYAAAQRLLAERGRVPVDLTHADAQYRLVTVWDDPRKPPVWVEVESLANDRSAQIRLFRRSAPT